MYYTSEDRRFKKIKSAIQKVVFEAIIAKKYDKLTVTAIAKAADINRKTFYLHYDTIDDVLNEYADNLGTNLENFLLDNQAISLREAINGINLLFQQNPKRFKELASNPLYVFFLIDCVNALKKAMTSFLKNNDSDNEWGVEKTNATNFASAGLIFTYLNWFTTDNKSSLDDLATQVIAMTGSVYQSYFPKEICF